MPSTNFQSLLKLAFLRIICRWLFRRSTRAFSQVVSRVSTVNNSMRDESIRRSSKADRETEELAAPIEFASWIRVRVQAASTLSLSLSLSLHLKMKMQRGVPSLVNSIILTRDGFPFQFFIWSRLWEDKEEEEEFPLISRNLFKVSIFNGSLNEERATAPCFPLFEFFHLLMYFMTFTLERCEK